MRRTWILLALACELAAAENPDWRHISRGSIIPDETYADQPYIVKTGDGAWLCVLTTGSGVEGAGGQHIVSTRSTDRGKNGPHRLTSNRPAVRRPPTPCS